MLERDREAPKQQRHTAQRIFARLVAEQDYDGGYTIVKDAVRAWRQPSINKRLVTELMRGDEIDQRESIILIGNAGTGTTHLATALGVEACGQGRKVRFWQVTELRPKRNSSRR